MALTPPPPTEVVAKLTPQEYDTSTVCVSIKFHHPPLNPTKKLDNLFNKCKKYVVGYHSGHKKDTIFCHKNNG